MFGNQGYAGYQVQSPYQPQSYRPVYQQPQMQADPGAINARYVTGREEAVAAQIIPDGNVFLFYDPTNRVVYGKRFNPQTNSAEFMEFRGPAPIEQPGNAGGITMEMFMQLKGEVDQIKQTMMAAPQSRQKAQKEAAE